MRIVRDRLSASIAAVSALAAAFAGAQVLPTGPAAPGARKVQVPASRAWTPTGVTLRQDQLVRIEASGTIDAAREEAGAAEPDELRLRSGKVLKGDCIDVGKDEIVFRSEEGAKAYRRSDVLALIFGNPGGGRPAVASHLQVPPHGRTDAPGTFPYPEAPALALIGRIADGKPFLVGSGRAFAAGASGELLLGPNDGDVADNSGAWSVEIYTETGAAPGEPSGPGVPQAAESSGVVTPGEGGVIRLPGAQTTLTVPPGAVERDTTIRLTQFHYPQPLRGGPLSELYLEPSGLRLKKAATLTMVVPPGKDADTLTVHSLSTANEPVPSGGGVNLCRWIPDCRFEAATRTLTVPIEHFSWFVAGDEEPMYLVFEIPGKYLRKGDILCTLSDRLKGERGGSWWMGHVGMYLGTKDPSGTTNDGQTIIESQVRDPMYGYPRHGPQFSTLTNFIHYRNNQHLYMGARKPLPYRYKEVTDSQRTLIAAYACELEKAKVGFAHLGWMPMELPFDNVLGLVGNGISCIAMVERSYQAAGIYVIPAFFSKQVLLHRPIWSPIGEYVNTAPVNEVEIGVGEKLEDIIVKGVTKERLSNPLGYLTRRGADYYDDWEFFKFTVSELPGSENEALTQEAIRTQRAKLIQNGQFSFTAEQKEAGKTLAFRFTVEDVKHRRGTREETLFVKVRDREERRPVWLLKAGFPAIDPYKAAGKGEEVVDGGKKPPFEFYVTHQYTAVTEQRISSRRRMVIRNEPVYDWSFDFNVGSEVPRAIRPGQTLSVRVTGTAAAALEKGGYRTNSSFDISSSGALYRDRTEGPGPNEPPRDLTVGWVKDKLYPKAERTFHFKVNESNLDTTMSLSLDLLAKYEWEKKEMTQRELQDYLTRTQRSAPRPAARRQGR